MNIKIKGIDYNSNNKVYSKNKVEQQLYKDIKMAIDDIKYKNITKEEMINAVSYVFDKIS